MSGTGAPSHERTLLLADDADPAALTALADDHGWKLEYTDDFRRDGLGQRVWEADDGTLIRELEYHAYGTRFVSVSGASPEAVGPPVTAVTRALPTIPLETVVSGLSAPDAAPADLVHGLRLLQTAHFMACRSTATAAGEPADAAYGAVIERLLLHPQRQVRLTAMLVADHLRPIAPELADLVAARHGAEQELSDLVEAFVAVAAERRSTTDGV